MLTNYGDRKFADALHQVIPKGRTILLVIAVPVVYVAMHATLDFCVHVSQIDEGPHFQLTDGKVHNVNRLFAGAYTSVFC